MSEQKRGRKLNKRIDATMRNVDSFMDDSENMLADHGLSIEQHKGCREVQINNFSNLSTVIMRTEMLEKNRYKEYIVEGHLDNPTGSYEDDTFITLRYSKGLLLGGRKGYELAKSLTESQIENHLNSIDTVLTTAEPSDMDYTRPNICIERQTYESYAADIAHLCSYVNTAQKADMHTEDGSVIDYGAEGKMVLGEFDNMHLVGLYFGSLAVNLCVERETDVHVWRPWQIIVQSRESGGNPLPFDMRNAVSLHAMVEQMLYDFSVECDAPSGVAHLLRQGNCTPKQVIKSL